MLSPGLSEGDCCMRNCTFTHSYAVHSHLRDAVVVNEGSGHNEHMENLMRLKLVVKE